MHACLSVLADDGTPRRGELSVTHPMPSLQRFAPAGFCARVKVPSEETQSQTCEGGDDEASVREAEGGGGAFQL